MLCRHMRLGLEEIEIVVLLSGVEDYVSSPRFQTLTGTLVF